MATTTQKALSAYFCNKFNFVSVKITQTKEKRKAYSNKMHRKNCEVKMRNYFPMNHKQILMMQGSFQKDHIGTQINITSPSIMGNNKQEITMFYVLNVQQLDEDFCEMTSVTYELLHKRRVLTIRDISIFHTVNMLYKQSLNF